MDLSTNYLGLKLKNPIVPSASPLSKNIDSAKALEDAGASALVMFSLFEEEIQTQDAMLSSLESYQAMGHFEADSYLPKPNEFTSIMDNYLNQIENLKQSLEIPVIASLNGVTDSGWVNHAHEIELAGADALELNIYYIPTNVAEKAAKVEQRYVEIVKHIKKLIKIPLICKIGSQFSAPLHFVKKLEAAGADGVALFNRFYQPDLNLENLKIDPKITLSTSSESLLRIHWIALLREHTNISLAATGGVNCSEDVLKLLLVGADVTHVCSAVLKHGASKITEMLKEVEQWLQDNEYSSVQQLKGSVSKGKAINPIAFERLNYLEVLKSYTL